MCEGTKEQEIDWRIGVASAAGYADVLQVYCGEARAEREAESLILLVDLPSCPHLW